MSERWVSIAVEGATMSAFLAEPQGKPAGGLVMLQEIFGVNEAMREKARRFAALGYAVLVPDLFWRQQPRVELGYGEQDRQRGFALMQGFDFTAGVQDVAAAARWLEAHDGTRRRVAVLGFCLGGKLAVAANRAYPFAAVASLYGVRLDADPQALQAIDAPLQFHVGDRDAHIPAAAVDAVRSALRDKPNAQVFVYPGAQHGFFNAVRAEVYAADAAQQAQRRIERMLALTLRS